MSESEGTYQIPDKPLTEHEKDNTRYAYFGLRPRPDPALELPESCQMPGCPTLAARTLTLQSKKLNLAVEVVMCDQHADRFYPPVRKRRKR